VFNNFRLNITPVCKQLLIINVICFIGTQCNDLLNLFALYYPTSPNFKPFQLVTHFFMHGSVMHIFFNMLGLISLGSMLEAVWGPKRFLQFYLICALGAAAVHLGMQYWEYSQLQKLIDALATSHSGDYYQQFLTKMSKDGYEISSAMNYAGQTFGEQDTKDAIEQMHRFMEAKSNIPTVGASGAIYGLLAGIWYLFPEIEFYMYFIPIPVKARYMVPLLLASDLFFGFSRFSNDNVAHFAHVGGAMVGFLILVFWYGKSMGRLR
jgi:membrane associated rhomboid family serine protease